MRFAIFGTALAALALAGCAPSEPSGAIRVTGMSNGGSEIDREKSYTTAAGAPVKVGSAMALNPDCSSQPGLEARLVTQPQNGTATIETAKDVAQPPPQSPAASCAGKLLDAVVTTYTPAPGFVGVDRFTFQVFFPNGRSFRNDVVVTVQ